MKLSAPKNITFWIAVLVAVIGVIARLMIPALSVIEFWLVVIAFIILLLGNLIDGM
jgi:threonine/homoserine/homoserine lactone efflux protein